LSEQYAKLSIMIIVLTSYKVKKFLVNSHPVGFFTQKMKDLQRLYKEYTGEEPETISPLSGSGSNRSYVRMAGSSGTYMGVKGTDARENNAFISLARHFLSKGIPVPEVLSVSDDGMSYLQQDLGDALLSDMVAKAGREGGIEEGGALEKLLCMTMGLLPRIQFEGARGLDFSVCYPQPSFDRRMVLFDLNYFKYCFLKPSGLEFDEVLLQNDFERLADDLLQECTDTFLYRDFNARNVMIKDGDPYFIDFQGGRKGPIYYDVASFVWQARARYPQWLKDRMVQSYLDALAEYVSVERSHFDRRLRLFILFRTLQTFGAYGFRGLVEHKAQFVVSIPPAMEGLRDLLKEPFEAYPYLNDTLMRMSALPKFAPEISDGRLEVKVFSFSFKKGIPQDMSGNGGGYVFDCRSIHNPGRYEPYKKLTGMDEPVIRFLEEDGEIIGFLEHVYGVVDPHVETFRGRGFTSLMVSFGCTGGQHRSVYCAEHLARHLSEKYPDVRVRLIHREQNVDRVL
jgi:aminoglycoside/choline kinase family phosphotransferase